jgi:hypothetical protein
LSDKKVDCVLTLDYELFLKKSGTALNSLLKPTKCLLDTLAKINGKATFFVDTMYLLLLKSSKDPIHYDVYKQLEEQLINIIYKGHRIELHLHPHWLEAYSSNGEWMFPSYEHYKLNSLSTEKINELFKQGTELLNNIAQNADPHYSVIAFRAGGYCIEPFKTLKKVFIENNIKIDSSVVPLMKLDGDIHNLDYSVINPISHYFFSDSIRQINTTGDFLEVPINGYNINRYERIINLIKNKTSKNAKIFGDGVGISMVKKRSTFEKMHSYLLHKKQYRKFTFVGYVNKNTLIKKISKANLPFITFVAHPKTITVSSLQAIEYLGERGHKFILLNNILDLLKQ